MEQVEEMQVEEKEPVLTNSELWYWICTIHGIGHKKISELLCYFNTVECIFEATGNELSFVEGISKNNIRDIVESKDIKRIKKEYIEIQRKGYQFISIEDSRYPKKLRTLYDPPYGIYVNGKLPKENVLTIGIVGARSCSQYGKEVAKYFGYHLAEAGVQIVSGLARGIDGYSHEGALRAKGYTLGVLGSGVDYCYPSENMELYMKMEQSGGIMSEYPLGTVPRAGNFPRRNRLISGMCDGLLVIEAKLKSGSLITVDQALEQGRDVFAIPGRITDMLSSGTNNLIKMGAELVTTPQEILEFYRTRYEEKEDLKQEKNVMEQIANNPLFEGTLSEEEQLVYGILSLDPKHIDVIAEQTKLSIPRLMSILIGMELKGYISQTIRNYYTRSL
ncbi:MAG: DNA-processing protein DprA [bacterium]|nr:DNA-processing protein DprA [bacterium]